MRTESIEALVTLHGGIACAHDRRFSASTNCADPLSDLLVLLRSRAALHNTFDFEDGASFEVALASANAFAEAIDDNAPADAALETLRDDFNNKVLELIRKIAAGYK